MWLTLFKGVAFKLLSALKSPVTWIVLLALLSVFAFRGWQGAREDVKAATEACQAATALARAHAAEEAAEAWRGIFAAHQEAVVRLALAEAQQEAAARHWRQKYQQALKVSPACASWAAAPISCPID